MPDEPVVAPIPDTDSVGTITPVSRNNGPISANAAKRVRRSSKNHGTTTATTGSTSLTHNSSDEGGATSDDNSGEDMQIADEQTLRQLHVLQEQVRSQMFKSFSFLFLTLLLFD